MEISERELNALTAEVEDLHREGMETMPQDIAELHAGEGRQFVEESHRSFVSGIGMGGLAALTIGALTIPLASLWDAAYAAPSADVAIAKYAESVELAAVAAYGIAAKSGLIKGAGLTTAEAFAKQHEDHAKAFGAYAGDASKAKANPGLVKALGPQFESAKTETDLVKLAYTVENAAASTYLYAIGALTDPTAQALTATILPVESQHAVVWGLVLGYTPGSPSDYIPTFVGTSEALAPSKYPIASGT
jgi:rubrerythrin